MHDDAHPVEAGPCRVRRGAHLCGLHHHPAPAHDEGVRAAEADHGGHQRPAGVGHLRYAHRQGICQRGPGGGEVPGRQ